MTLGGISLSAGCLARGPSPEEQAREAREPLSKYRDVSAALADGYRTAATYVRSDDGVVGTPFVDRSVDELDPERPQVLLYDLTSEGRYELMGAKWYRPTEETDSPPSLFGKSFAGPQEDEVSLVPEHYGLTAWLFRENPEGLFRSANPAVEPAELVSTVESLREGLRDYLAGRGATEDGYRNTEKCVGTERGGYGVPFVDESARTTGGTDPTRPPILLYRVTPAWSYRLVGAEWFVPAAETDSRPSMFGFEFHEPTGAHSPKVDQPEHVGLHAWLFRANPGGMFAPFNPTLSCR
ncbi:MAG: hypothetical protein ABEJ26_12280 [Halosimplex sp.]